MSKRLMLLLVLFSSLPLSRIAFCQYVDSTSFKMNSRLSFYSYEKSGEFLLHIPSGLSQNNLSIDIKIENKTIASWNGKPGRNLLRIPFVISLKPSVYKTEASILIKTNQVKNYLAVTHLIILSGKPNEVKTDRLTGGMIVNRLPFFPFGFYCYSPVYPTLSEEEVVKGFNMISPYQKILPEALSERKAYMDRCAEIGRAHV
jgi:hypothetical protein